MTRILPARVGIPLQAEEAGQLLDLAGKIPMTTHSTVAKVALLLGLQQLSGNPQMVENLIGAGLARRPGRGRPRRITLTGREEHTNPPHEETGKSNEIDPDSTSRPGHHAKNSVTE